MLSEAAVTQPVGVTQHEVHEDVLHHPVHIRTTADNQLCAELIMRVVAAVS